jgi:hypothetical protein
VGRGLPSARRLCCEHAFASTPLPPLQEDDEIAHQAAKSRDDWQFNLLKWFIGQVTEK